MDIRLKRAYEAPSEDDGVRVLVDRLWPRGVSRAEARIDRWLKEIAPSSGLRTWFGHDPGKWEEFCSRYFDELEANPETVSEIETLLREGTVTLVYGARDEEHNNAVALRRFLVARRSGE